MKRIICLILIVLIISFGIFPFRIGKTRYILVCAIDMIDMPYITIRELPTKNAGGETSLEFWIGEYVREKDYEAYHKVYDGFLGKGYDSMEPADYYVHYEVGVYPHVYSGKRGITEITITDPSVTVFGLTTESGIEDFAAVFEELGAESSIGDNYVNAWIGDVRFRYFNGGGKKLPYISIKTEATGVVYID